MQDTIRQKILTGNDSLTGHLSKVSVQADTGKITALRHQRPLPGPEIINTVSDCSGNVSANATFSDSSGFVRNIKTLKHEEFPFIFISKNLEIYSKKQEVLLKSLRDGQPLPAEQLKADWIIPILFFSALLLGVIRSVPGNYFRSMFRFLFMRGINENASRDTGVLFQWQSTLLNLSAFISISMLCYLIFRHYDIVIPRVDQFVTWLICFAIIISAVTLRHLACNIIGSISDEQEIFREYLIGIYQAYRFAGILFLILSVLILYTVTVPVKIYFFAGITIAGLLYILRIIRLFLIFIRRHVSLLYLILYLCALEILPVVILVKYVTGLV
jgi:Domain of unknown function (DUF4271)